MALSWGAPESWIPQWFQPHRPMSDKFNNLILEDEPLCAEMLARIIEREGGKATVCENLQAARLAVRQQHFDLFTLDHQLPDGTGSSFFYELREQGLLSPAIMLTGLPDLPTAVQLTRSGLFDYLTKPFEVKQFLDCLHRALLLFNYAEPDESFLDFVGRSAASKEVRRLVQHAADNPDANVLLTGETGVGKDLTARMIHQLTFQQKNPQPPLISLNCSTLPADMFEAELFGAEKGAYTGAHQQRLGLVEAANGGTLFLDEIGEVPLPMQAKLLRFLETQEYRRLGSTETFLFMGRIIAATNKPLEEEVKAGRFRADLWYRLDVFSIHVLPLRERKEDLAGLCELLLRKLSDKYQHKKPVIKPEDFEVMMNCDFPGNVRELRNLLERSLLQTAVDANWLELDRAWLRKAREAKSPAQPVESAAPATTAERSFTALEAQEYSLIQKTLREEGGAIRRAAVRLGLTHQSLLRRLQKWPELRAAV